MTHLDAGFLARWTSGEIAPDEVAEAQRHCAVCPVCHERAERALGRSVGTPDTAATFIAKGHESSLVVNNAKRLPRGTTLGRYVIIDRIGEGGLGVVYSAYDPELDRKIALKLLRPRSSRISWVDVTLPSPGASAASEAALPDPLMDPDQVRLVREAQAMARLTHPNVVAIHDVGTWQDRVFIAMELVEGQTLKAWLRERPRTWREVVGAFHQAGRGLAGAHAANLVHRDFKPDNVLIGKDGRARVTDFGLARAAGMSGDSACDSLPPTPEERGHTSGPLETPLTRAGAVMGTVGFVAPEQLQGEPADARSDQFSFCVALYEGLYGERPFKGRTLEAYKESLEEGVPAAASSPRRVPPNLRKIVMRGLSFAPAERFPSMDALLGELERDPELRTRRWLIAPAVMVTLAAVGLGVSQWKLRQERECEAGAQRLVGAWDAPMKEKVHAAFGATGKAYSEDSWTRVAGALDADAARWVAAREEACKATRLRHEQTEEIMLRRLACLDGRLAELKALAEVFAGADAKVLQKATEAASSLSAPEACLNVKMLRAEPAPPSDPAEQMRVERLRTQLAEGKALRESGQYKRASEMLGPLVDAAHGASRTVEAEALELRGIVNELLGDYRLAEQDLASAFTKALAVPDDVVAARAAARQVRNVGYLEAHLDEGRRWAGLSQAMIDRLGGDDGLQAMLFNYIGSLEKQSGEYQAELDHSLQTLELSTRVYGPDALQTLRAVDNLGVAYSDVRDWDKAAVLGKQAAEGMEKLLGPKHPDLAIHLANYAAALGALGRYTEALAVARRALDLDLDGFGPSHPDTAFSLSLVAGYYRELGDCRTALGYAKRSVETYEKSTGSETIDITEGLDEMAMDLVGLGQPREALRILDRSIGLRERLAGPNNADIQDSLDAAGRAYLALGEPKKAIPLLERALKFREQRPNEKGQAGVTRFTLARALREAKSDADRGRALALQAKAELQAAQMPTYGPLLAQIDDWLR
jgi:eukaryotic-like serine/threonine-protein kinase